MRGVRFCHVAEAGVARRIADGLRDLGLDATDMDGAGDRFCGAVFPTGDGTSWAEIWAEADGMPAGTMLQLVVDDAEAHADAARRAGRSVEGPFDMHGERIYHVILSGGLQCAIVGPQPHATICP